jgi:outer membrane protein TolC
MSRRIHVYILILLLLLDISIGLSLAQSKNKLPIKNIGMVVDGYWERNEEILDLTKKEILELTQKEFDVRFPPDKTLDGKWNADKVRKAINSLLSDSEVDLVIAWGVMASNIFCCRRDLPKPVIAPAIIDAELQGLPMIRGISGVKNLNYVSFPNNIEADIRAFFNIIPFKKLAVFVNKITYEAMPILSEKSSEALQSAGIEGFIIPVERTAEEALALLPIDVDAAYIAPIIHIPSEEFDEIIQGLNNRKIPSFSFFGRKEVEQGVLAGIKPDVFPKLIRRVSLNVQRILLGEDAGSIPVAFAVGQQLTLNMATARAIGLSPTWEVLTEAELINEEEEEVKRKLDLFTAVQEAIAANLDVAAKERFVIAGEENVKEARASLRPQINISGLGLLIDEDRAEASFGQQAERSVSGSATISQLIYSEPAWANLSIQKNIQKIREEELHQLRLDIIQEAATAYLNVLKAKTFERIQKENLKRTRSNLEIARVREVVGSAEPAEVYRWESEIASNRKIVLEAKAQRSLAEIELNRLMHRPLEEQIKTMEVGLEDPTFVTSEERLLKYYRNPRAFQIFRAFLVEEALKVSPELAILDAAIAAQQRALRSASSSFWSPTIAFNAGAERFFSRDGAGSDRQFAQSLPFSFPQIDDTNWSVSVNLVFPLFQGGAKFALKTKADKELLQLQLERQSVAERIDQSMRTTMLKAFASHSGIRQARLAAEAASKSLEVVENAYSRGVIAILNLLDAQNTALVADLAAANAVYDFLIDLMAVERASGDYYFFETAEEREIFFQRLEDYFQKTENTFH